MAGCGRNYRAKTLLRQYRVGYPSVVFGLDAFGETAFAQSPQMMRQSTTLPANDIGQIGDLQLVFRRIAQRAEHVIVGQRELTISLQLAVHLVVHLELHTHEGSPRTLV